MLRKPPRAAEHVHSLEAEMRAQRFQIVDLIRKRAGLPRLQGSGASIAALVVENDAPSFRQRIPSG
jgi:hypothetical protein